jgi:hypothetical protein
MKRGLEWGVRVVQHEPPLQHSVETQRAALSLRVNFTRAWKQRCLIPSDST